MSGLEHLEEFRDVTVAELQLAIAQIPSRIRSELEKGPNPRRHTCGVCRAFGGAWYKTVDFKRDDAMSIVFLYHEVPKLDMKVADDQWYGNAANDVYRRCVETYRAAGWTGEAEEPNA